MFVSTSIIFTLFTVPFISALPSVEIRDVSPPLPQSFRQPGCNCPLTGATINFPPGQTALTVPNGSPKFVTLGVGVQNYTCVSGTWTSIGAVASLYDISCAVGTPLMNVSNPSANAMLKTIAMRSQPIISHFFANSTAGVLPRFNKEPFKTSNLFSVASKKAALPSPQGPTNIPWLQLTNVEGTLASMVYRVDTQLGQPPASCDPAKDVNVQTVQYTAKYYFY